MLFLTFVKVLVIITFCSNVHCYIYDFYSGEILPPDYVLRTASKPNFRDCSVRIDDCSPLEGRRIDGSCNNIKHPSFAMNRNTYQRLLPPKFGPNNSIPKFAEDGSELPLARKVRTTLQPSARVISKRFNMNALHYTGFATFDITRIDGVFNYLFVKTDCCTPAGEHDPKCMPLYVPQDDPYLHNSGVRCMNLTRMMTFQEISCITGDEPFAPINHQTPLLDLSQVYGQNETVANALRTMEGGLLKMEWRKKRYVPRGKDASCLANKKGEPCYEMGDPNLNFQPKLTMVGLWYSRLHNSLAAQLSLLNPCWNDQHLYQTAREINIAISQKIAFYELFPLFLGKKNMIAHGLLSKDLGYMNVYDEKKDPRTLAEYETGFRILHSLLDDSFALYDKAANVIGSTALNLWLFGIGVLENDDNMETMSRSMFYQPASDSRLHSDVAMSNNMFTRFNKANDLFSIDIQRHRDMGVRSYNMYRHYCGLPKAHHWDDFRDYIDDEQIIALKKLYETVEAVELSAGLIAERDLPGANVGPTLWCIISEQLRILRDADRFWFENGKEKNKLSLHQLHEIHKYTVSRLACDTADGVFKVQPNGFQPVSEYNPIIPCEEIPTLDLTKWKDSFCKSIPAN